jgi:hypothetical protein
MPKNPRNQEGRVSLRLRCKGFSAELSAPLRLLGLTALLIFNYQPLEGGSLRSEQPAISRSCEKSLAAEVSAIAHTFAPDGIASPSAVR